MYVLLEPSMLLERFCVFKPFSFFFSAMEIDEFIDQ
jgi:hypothetical protein